MMSKVTSSMVWMVITWFVNYAGGKVLEVVKMGIETSN